MLEFDAKIKRLQKHSKTARELAREQSKNALSTPDVETMKLSILHELKTDIQCEVTKYENKLKL